jgi:hypothetical protein
LKNRILLDNYYLPGDLERQIGAFVDHPSIAARPRFGIAFQTMCEPRSST